MRCWCCSQQLRSSSPPSEWPTRRRRKGWGSWPPPPPPPPRRSRSCPCPPRRCSRPSPAATRPRRPPPACTTPRSPPRCRRRSPLRRRLRPLPGPRAHAAVRVLDARLQRIAHPRRRRAERHRPVLVHVGDGDDDRLLRRLRPFAGPAGRRHHQHVLVVPLRVGRRRARRVLRVLEVRGGGEGQHARARHDGELRLVGAGR